MIVECNCRFFHFMFYFLLFIFWHFSSFNVISGGSRIFPRGGREPSRGGVNTPNFPENCMKSKEFGRPGGGRASLTPPLDPPMVMTKLEFLPTADFLLSRLLFYSFHCHINCLILQEKGTILDFTLIHDNFNVHNAMVKIQCLRWKRKYL